MQKAMEMRCSIAFCAIGKFFLSHKNATRICVKLHELIIALLYMCYGLVIFLRPESWQSDRAKSLYCKGISDENIGDEYEQ